MKKKIIIIGLIFLCSSIIIACVIVKNYKNQETVVETLSENAINEESISENDEIQKNEENIEMVQENGETTSRESKEEGLLDIKKEIISQEKEDSKTIEQAKSQTQEVTTINKKIEKKEERITDNNSKEQMQEKQATQKSVEISKEESNSEPIADKKTTTSNRNNEEKQKKIDLSKYDFYEAGKNGAYKGFVKDVDGINKLKNLINECIKENGYTNVKVLDNPDSSLAKSGARYFTANKINVNNAIFDCSNLTISYYAVKEYWITSDAKESYIQTRSYINVK